MRLLLVCALLALTGCASLAQDRLRADVRTATGCESPRILSWSPDVARVDACGSVKVCHYRMSPGGDRMQQASGVGGYWECGPG